MECSIKEDRKISQAMKNYKMAKFVYNFVLYSLTSLITCLFFSYPFWFPSAKHFLSSPPNMSSFFNAKCLFIVGNLIVFILIGESKMQKPPQSSPTWDVYDEYVARSRCSYRKVIKSMQSLNVEEKKHGIEDKIHHEEKKTEMKTRKSDTMPREKKKQQIRVCKSENVKREKTKGREEENLDIPREELNKRVEAFIARVNKQRLLEAKSVDHFRG